MCNVIARGIYDYHSCFLEDGCGVDVLWTVIVWGGVRKMEVFFWCGVLNIFLPLGGLFFVKFFLRVLKTPIK